MPRRILFKIACVALLTAGFPLAVQASDQEQIAFKQLHVGFNGPDKSGRYIYASPTDLASSWLVESLGEQTQSVLSQVDFSHQILIVATVGERPTTTGNISISEIWKFGAGIVPYVKIGVNERDCNKPRHASFPFVIAVIERPENFDKNTGGYDNQNFADGCKEVPSGAAAAL